MEHVSFLLVEFKSIVFLDVLRDMLTSSSRSTAHALISVTVRKSLNAEVDCSVRFSFFYESYKR